MSREVKWVKSVEMAVSCSCQYINYPVSTHVAPLYFKRSTFSSTQIPERHKTA